MDFILATSDDTQVSSAMLAAMGAMMGTILIVTVVVTVFFCWLFWRIFTRAGYSGAMGLLCLIPSVGPLICLLILAFGEWPIYRAQPQYTGTSVMQ